jgi:hypothetical protein
MKFANDQIQLSLLIFSSRFILLMDARYRYMSTD